jgi:hypothetical protein
MEVSGEAKSRYTIESLVCNHEALVIPARISR